MGRDRTISLNTTVKLYEEFEGSFTFGQKHSYKWLGHHLSITLRYWVYEGFGLHAVRIDLVF
jgi:hypothetical protein